jgi:hypothetical protein
MLGMDTGRGMGVRGVRGLFMGSRGVIERVWVGLNESDGKGLG